MNEEEKCESKHLMIFPTQGELEPSAEKGQKMHRAAVHSIKNIPPNQRIFLAECLEKKYVGGGVSSFTFRAEPDARNNESFSFRPGQWIDMFIPDVDVVGGFSMTSIPSQLPYFSLAIKDADHPPTRWLTSECQVGDFVTIRSGGDFFWTEECSMPVPESSIDAKKEDRILLVAGGIGINPLFSILLEVSHCLQSATPSKPGPKCAILYTAKDLDSLVFLDSINACVQEHPGMLHSCMKTTGNNGIDTATDQLGVGRLQVADFEGAISFLKSDHNGESNATGEKNIISYLCGPPSFCDGYEELLHQLEIKDTRVERWW